MNNKFDYLEGLEKKIEKIDSKCFVNVFNSGIVLDVNKMMVYGVKILRVYLSTKGKKGKRRSK